MSFEWEASIRTRTVLSTKAKFGGSSSIATASRCEKASESENVSAARHLFVGSRRQHRQADDLLEAVETRCSKECQFRLGHESGHECTKFGHPAYRKCC